MWHCKPNKCKKKIICKRGLSFESDPITSKYMKEMAFCE